VNFLLSSLYFGVLLSSLSGSLHCVGMCGGLMINVAKKPIEDTWYHLGRLISYLALGAIAGYLGNKLFSSELLRSLQLLTSVAMGLFFCWMAFRVWRNQAFHFSFIPNSFLIRVQQWSLNRKLISPAFLVGLSSGLLPCGWLHTFVIAAIATESPTQGAILLFIFWLGTVPALAVSRVALQKMSGPLTRNSSKILALILLGIGIATLTLKCYPLYAHPTEAGNSCPFHHEE